MLSRRIFCFFALFLVAYTGFAQVNLQTGSATFSLPMFEWKDHISRLQSVVALSYNSGNGLKVNDVASNVGQGWNLIAGGVITRMQVGEPDDQKAYGQATEKDISKYPNGKLYAERPTTDGCPGNLAKYPLYEHMNQVYAQHNEVTEDKQLDYFSFQFNGKSGMFVLDTTEGDHGVMLGDSRIKITFQRNESMANSTYNGTRTTITSFTIQDVDGLIYKFTRHGKTRVLQTQYCDVNLTQALTQPKFESGKVYYQAGFENTDDYKNSWIIGSWYLTEIEDALTHRKVFLYYTDRTVNNIAGQDFSYNQEGNYTTVTFKRSITITPEITSISFPDYHVVTFNYGSGRYDLNGQYALASVDVTYLGRYLSKHILRTTYFVGNRYGKPESFFQKKAARLCLRSVEKFGVDLKEASQPYIFDYYTGSNAADDVVPPPFAYTKDIWGFYNGSNSVGYSNEAIPLGGSVQFLNNEQLKGLCFLRTGVSGVYLNPKAGYAKNGLLRQIIYPTGGTLTYEYAQNTGELNSAEQNVGGVHVSKVSTTDGGYSNGCDNAIVTNYNYVLSGGTNSSLWGLEMPVNSMTSTVYYEAEYKKYKWSLSGCGGIFGCCYYKYTYPGIMALSQTVSLTDMQRFMQAVAPVLGVISIVTTVIDVVNLVFVSSGVMAWVAVIVDIVGGLVTLAVTCFSSNKTQTRVNTVYFNSDLNGISPLPAQFKRVEIVEGSGANGRTVQTFTSDEDYGIWAPTNPAFSAKQRFAPWAYGLPKTTTVLDALGNKVRETANTYSWNAKVTTCHPGGPCIFMVKQPLELMSCKCQVKRSSSQRVVDWVNPDFYNASYTTQTTTDIAVDIYDLYTGRVELTETSEKIFKTNDPAQYVETITAFQYHTLNYAPTIISTSSNDGTYSSKRFRYPDDYVVGDGTSNEEINTLYDNNIVVEPIKVIENINERVTIFTTLANGNVVPWKTLEQRFSEPPPMGIREWSPDDPTYWGNYKTIQTLTYDNYGSLIGVMDEGSRLVTNIYDYGNKYVSASIINADPVTDKCAYSSFETFSFGGWGISGSGPDYVSNSITGMRAFNLASNTLSRTLNTLKPYSLSFWANNSNVVVTGGATLVVSAPTRNGFTYYEYSIAQGTGSVSVSGNAYIDELRLHPAAARMRTVTYDPLIGKTSECDETNRITYYEYDNLGRLRFIKDENRNIVKMYEYNSVSKLSGCPEIYYSKLTTEVFTKSDCGPGYIGSEVIYTVPANKYSSTISQEDADAKVDDELLAMGQNYANANGSCTQLYYNTQQSADFTTQSCAPGYIGGLVPYTVPAGRYSTTESQAAADQMALDEIAANGQAWANDPANAICTPDATPDWEWFNGTSYCYNVNGQLPAHLFILEIDVNPNSPSFGVPRWSDVGPDDACSPGLYFNTDQSGDYFSQNCDPGYEPLPYHVSKLPGTYSSTVSVQDANDQATQDAQDEANMYGDCQPVMVELEYENNGSDYVDIEFYNVSTGESYYFEVEYNSDGDLGSIPAGVYDITFIPYNTTIEHDYNFACGIDDEAVDYITFEDVTISPECNDIYIYTPE